MWKCKHCGNYFHPSLSSQSFLEQETVFQFLTTRNIDEIQNVFYEKMTFVLVGTFNEKCEKCHTNIEYKSLIELGNIDIENNRFQKNKDILVSSNNLELVQTGFIFRGADIHDILPGVLLKWWVEGKKIYVINPFITIEGMKILSAAGYYIDNYCHSISKTKLDRSPFNKIIMQKNQNFNKDTPGSLLKKAENEIVNENEDLIYMMKSPGFDSIKNKLLITSQLEEHQESRESHLRNSGKFHGKLYAGVSKDSSELIITSYNLIESENLQMETFQYDLNYDDVWITSEINKLIDDRFMRVEKELT